MLINAPKKVIKVQEYKCPVCDNDNYKEVEKENIFGINIGICNLCGFIYRPKFLTEKSFLEYMRYYHKSIPDSGYFKRDLMKAHLIKGLINFSKKDRILDIGSGIGTALHNHNIVKLELARSHYLYDLHGNNSSKTRNTFYIKDGNFDLILMHNIINFIPNIGKYLRDLNEKLKDDGMLYICLPVIDVPGNDAIRFEKAQQFFSFYTSETARNLLENCGYIIENEYWNIFNHIFICKKNPSKEQRIKKTNGENEWNRFMNLLNEIKVQNSIKQEERDFNKLIKINPMFAGAWTARMITNTHNEKMDDALLDEHVTEIIKNFGDYVPLMPEISMYYYSRKRYEEAINMIEKAKIYVYDENLLKTLGLCYYDLGVYDIAAKYLKEAKKIESYSSNNELIKQISACYNAMREDIDE